MSDTTERDMEAVKRVVAALSGLPAESQLRVIRTVAAFCGFDPDKLPALALEYMEARR